MTSASHILPPIFRKGKGSGRGRIPEGFSPFNDPPPFRRDVTGTMLYREEQSGEKTSDFYREQRREGRPPPSRIMLNGFTLNSRGGEGHFFPRANVAKKKKRGKRQPRNRGESFVAAEKRHEANNNPWKKFAIIIGLSGTGQSRPHFSLFSFSFPPSSQQRSFRNARNTWSRFNDRILAA